MNDFGSPASSVEAERDDGVVTAFEGNSKPPHDFSYLNGEEIFELFVSDKKNHVGRCARFIFTRLPGVSKLHKNNLSQTVDWCTPIGKAISKRKAEKQTQKHAWLSLMEHGGEELLSRIRNLCSEFFYAQARKSERATLRKAKEDATEGALTLDVSDNFAARVIHYAIEDGTKDLMNTIFECETSRMS